MYLVAQCFDWQTDRLIGFYAIKLLILILIVFLHEAILHRMILLGKNTTIWYIGFLILFLLHSVNFGVKRQMQQYLGLEDTQQSARQGKQ